MDTIKGEYINKITLNKDDCVISYFLKSMEEYIYFVSSCNSPLAEIDGKLYEMKTRMFIIDRPANDIAFPTRINEYDFSAVDLTYDIISEALIHIQNEYKDKEYKKFIFYSLEIMPSFVDNNIRCIVRSYIE
jgi:hypothetical protein